MNDAPLIRCAGVHKSYRLAGREIPALRGLDLTIERPGYYAVMGQSGSGKSTLLHLLGGLDRPDVGEVFVGDRALHGMNEREANLYRRKGVGIVFQQFNLIPTLNAKENVELPGLLAGEDAAWLADRSAELLERLGVAERASHRPDALSGGEQQRVAIGRALLFSPPIVLADEPTGNLDSASSEKLWSLLAELAAGDRTSIIMVTHEPAAAAHCRHVWVLSDGRVRGSFPAEGLDAGGVAARYQDCVAAA